MRTIDADALKEQFREGAYTVKGIREEIDNAPTVDIKPFALVSFDKDELKRIVDEQVIKPIENGELVVKTEERPQGEWITKEHSIEYYCSHCGERLDQCCEDFCCHCGADMRGDNNGN